jgi:dolichol-phosphate mannosyltransferase
MPELSIIVPCLNQEQTLPLAISRLNDVITQASLDAESIILDDESGDDTLNVAANLIDEYPSLHIRVFHRVRRRRGFGAVVRYGMAHATGRYCAFVSADGLDPVHLIPEFVKRLRSGAQHVQCSRYSRSEDKRLIPFKFRVYQSLYRRSLRVLLGRDVQDSTYGFRAFDRVYVQALGVTSNRFNLCPEILFKVMLSGGKAEHVPGSPAVPFGGGGSTSFLLPNEIGGYSYVLARAGLHRLGLYWF